MRAERGVLGLLAAVVGAASLAVAPDVSAPLPTGAAADHHLVAAIPVVAVAPAVSAVPLSYSAEAQPEPQLKLSPIAGGILVDLDQRQVLWSSDAASPHPPASLVKLFTVMVALDHADLDRMVTVPPEAVDTNPVDTVMGLKAGDQVTVRELIEGIWLVSGDDAAEALAQALMPRDQFVAAMNAKANLLGLAQTWLANPSGLDTPGQRSSAHDLAVAAGWLELHYPEAFALADQVEVTLPPNERHADDLSMHTLNRMVWNYQHTNRPFPGATGLKTGYTDDAGGCVIVTATRAGRHLIVVLLNDNWFYNDAATLLNYGFAHNR